MILDLGKIMTYTDFFCNDKPHAPVLLFSAPTIGKMQNFLIISWLKCGPVQSLYAPSFLLQKKKGK